MKTEHLFHKAFLLAFAVCTVCAVSALLWILFLTTSGPKSKLNALIQPSPTPISTLVVRLGDLSFATPSASLTKRSAIDNALSFLFSKPQKTNFDPEKVKAWIQTLSDTVHREATPAAVIARNSKTTPFIIVRGTSGQRLDVETTVQTIMQSEFVPTSAYVLQTKSTGSVLTDAEYESSKQRVQALLKKTLSLSIDGKTRTLTYIEFLPLLSLPNGYAHESVRAYISSLSKETGTQPVEPELIIENNQVKRFVPPKDGKVINEDQGTQLLLQALLTMETATKSPELTLPLVVTSPKKTLSSTNTLGIHERIGMGTSAYSHSIPNRVYNVAHTTAKIHAKLVMPGEEFSFNKYLGEVSKITGFKQAYVIKDGQTVLGDGGGVCQVSSTLFRAVLNAGLPITERKGHSYRVSYYEQNNKPGFDATVYSPHPDLRFVNDTGTPILINAVANSKDLTMYIELYGKSDGRKAEILNYKQWGAQPAPPALYQDDPSLPHGVVKQVDYAAPGLKTSFDYKVTYPNGKIQTTTYKTNYIPWRAVYLRGI